MMRAAALSLGLGALLFGASCSDSPDPCADGACRQSWLVTQIDILAPDQGQPPPILDASEIFACLNPIVLPAEEGWTSPGFDVDGESSVGDEERSCRTRDYLASEDGGAGGVDNAIGRLWQTIRCISAGDTADVLIQQGIDRGAILMIIEADGAEEVGAPMMVDAFAGKGDVLNGTDGRLLPFQTIARDTEAFSQPGAGERNDGGFEGHGLAFDLPLVLLGFNDVLPVSNASFRAEVAEDGSMVGTISGLTRRQDLLDLIGRLEAFNAADSMDAAVEVATRNFPLIIDTLMDVYSDEDGYCSLASLQVQVHAVPVFMRAPETPEATDE